MIQTIRQKYQTSWLGRERGITNGRLLGTTLALAVLFIAVPWIWWSDAQEAREQSARDLAQASYAAEVAVWENDRDEFTRCEQRVESREQIRGAFLGVYDLIDQLSPDNQFTVAARSQMDQTYPALSFDECPPVPDPPVPPLTD